MNRELTDDRIERFDFSNLKLNDTLLFCYDCDWQVTNTAMKPEYPNCGIPIYFIRVTKEILQYKQRNDNEN